MKSFFLISGLFLSSVVNADTINLTWVQPTLREDGSPLAVSEIKHYLLSWTVKGVVQPDKVVPVGTSYVLDTGSLSGKVCATLRTVDVDGLVSAPSNEDCRNAKPNPPSVLDLK